MIKLESIHIEEVRGIRNLDLNFSKETFAICGPNGSGKSGIIDAIEFGLTGQMGRLSGRGTKGLSVASHGPHVDKTKFPDAAFVELNVFLTDLKKSVKIRRIVSAPKRATMEPDEPDIRAVVEEVAEHPEITLSRRDILRFILVEPAKRSEEIQALLKLDMLGDARRALNAALNTLIRAQIATENQVKASRSAFLTHLQLSAIKTDDILDVINKKRTLLDLKKLDELTKETNLADGLTSVAGSADFNKESALRDIKALLDDHDKSGDLAMTEAEAIVRDLKVLDEEPTMLAALQRREFVDKGLAFVDKAECPLCDTAWPSIEHLRDHLRAKLAKSKEAKSLQDTLLANAGIVTGKVIQFAALIQPVARLAEIVGEKEFAEELRSWSNDLEAFRSNLSSIDKIRRLKERFATGWLKTPVTFTKGLTRLNDKIKARPNQSAAIDAGECGERRLQHREEAEKFYRDLAATGMKVRVGMEASGHARWFERLLGELQVELWIGDATEIARKRERKQKTDRQDAQHILRLLLKDDFPRLWVPSWENRDLRQLLWHRHRMVQARTRIMNQLQALALNEGLRCKKRLWREAGREQLESFGLAPWASRRRQDLLELLDRLNPTIAELTQAIEQEAEKCPPAQRLRTHPGVGALTALAFVLIIGEADRFHCGKQVASYLGRPGRERP